MSARKGEERMRFLVPVVLWVLVFFATGWAFWVFLVLACLATYFIVGRWVYRNATPWRRLYFPLIDRYAILSGAHLAIADRTGEAFSPKKPLAVLLNEFEPGHTDEETQFALDKWELDFESGRTDELFVTLLRERGASADRAVAMSEELGKRMRHGDGRNGFFVRYVIGEVIEARLGVAQKKAYWRAILSGRLE